MIIVFACHLDYAEHYGFHKLKSMLHRVIYVSLQCPDPHFKKRHHKRRVVQKPLVDSILKNLSPGGQVCTTWPFNYSERTVVL